MKRICDIEPITKGGALIKRKSELQKYVELPAIRACEYLWDQNIRTIASGANKQDIGRHAHISIDFETLSPANRKTAKQIGELSEYNSEVWVTISVPIPDADTPVDSISALLLKKAKRFSHQPLTWGYLTYEEAKKAYGYSEITKEVEKELQQSGYIPEPEEKRVWLSAELYAKYTSA